MDALLFKRPDNAGTVLKSNNSQLGSPYTWGAPSLAISPSLPGLPHLATGYSFTSICFHVYGFFSVCYSASPSPLKFFMGSWYNHTSQPIIFSFLKLISTSGIFLLLLLFCFHRSFPYFHSCLVSHFYIPVKPLAVF